MKKRAIIYVRVSTDEQKEKGYSLQAQEEKARDFCKKNDIEIVAVFSEDYTAWHGFDRPDYNKLNNLLLKNKIKVDYILFTQWSRFSRDYTESVIEIRRLKELGVVANAIEQWINYEIPENLYVLSFYLTAPQVENDRLSSRTKDGMRQATKEGRWLHKAPKGYKNNKVTKLIEVDTPIAELIKQAFQLMSTGLYTAEDVRRKLKEKGLDTSKQGFLDILQQVAYIGMVKLKALKDEPERLVKGLHEAIISEEIFNDVQLILKGKKKGYKGVTKGDDTPLVGHLYCHNCNRPMTGSGSRGNGGVYHYYHCQRKYGCKNEFNAKKANSIFTTYLRSYQPNEEMLTLYKAILEDVFKTNGVDSDAEKAKLKAEIIKVESQLESATMKYIDGKLSDENYNKVERTLENRKGELEVQLDNLNKFKPEFESYVSNSTLLISDLGSYYQNNDVETKKRIIGSIFPEKIYFENNEYRTTKINEIIELLSNGNKGLNENCHTKKVQQSTFAPLSFKLSNSFIRDLKSLSDTYRFIKAKELDKVHLISPQI